MTELKIGNPVEVQFFENRQGIIYETWLPATVVQRSDRQFAVAFSDGERLAIALHGGSVKWRKP